MAPPPIPPRKVSPASTPRPSPKHQQSNYHCQQTSSQIALINVANNNLTEPTVNFNSGNDIPIRSTLHLPKAISENTSLVENNNFWSNLTDNGNHLLG